MSKTLLALFLFLLYNIIKKGDKMTGIFIGSFNPPTLAHLDIVLKLHHDLSEIIFVPVNSSEKHLIAIDDRIKMLKVYTRKYPFLKIDDIMKDYAFFNYRLLDILQKKYGDITLIIGSDLLKKIESFDNYLYILNKYSFVVLKRENDDVERIIKEKYPRYSNKFKIVDYDNIISSSMARELIRKKQNNEDVLDKDIYDYIIKHNFYV